MADRPAGISGSPFGHPPYGVDAGVVVADHPSRIRRDASVIPGSVMTARLTR
jgi:hypothetical protein